MACKAYFVSASETFGTISTGKLGLSRYYKRVARFGRFLRRRTGTMPGRRSACLTLTSLMPNGSALRPPSMMSPLLYSEPVEEEDELTTTTLDEDESDCEEELTCAPESDEIEEKTPSPP